MNNPRIDNNNDWPGGGNPPASQPVKVNVTSLNNKNDGINDHRVKIRVPKNYLTNVLGSLGNLQGIIFPYTPTINYEFTAQYGDLKPLHSNFPINFYQRSTVSGISISGKFTVESQQDSEIYIATQRLLIALTRMKFGLDSDAGAPPPVCRLDAYGDMFLKNVPVAISSFRVEYPEDVDYYLNKKFNTSVPTRSTIAVTCIPMYSRNELQKFSVNNYITSQDKQGYI